MMQRFPLVSIVMLAWNRKDDVRESLRHIQKIDYEPLEIIVVDNASDDGTAQMVEAEFPDVHLIKMKKNIGIAAYNVGFEQAKGKYIVIIDDDSFPARHAIRRMVQVFEKDERLGAVAFDVRNYDHYDEIKNELEDTDETEEVKAVASDYLMSFNGAGVGIRKDLFKKIGYYPEEFFLYYNIIMKWIAPLKFGMQGIALNFILTLFLITSIRLKIALLGERRSTIQEMRFGSFGSIILWIWR